MKKLKKMLAGVLAFTMVASMLQVTSFASQEVQENDKFLPEDDIQVVISENEFEKYQNLRQRSIDELMQLGLSNDEAEEIKETSFEELVLERAKLPEEVLENMGYTEDDIEVLKAYDGETLTANSEIVTRAAAVCSASIRPVMSTGSGTGRKITFRYAWVWNKSPIVTSGDSVAVTWFAYDEEANSKNSGIGSRSGSVTYVDYATGAKQEVALSTKKETADSASKVMVYANFPIRKDYNSTGGKWAKSGELRVQVTTGGKNYILDSIEVAGKYGHSTLDTKDMAAQLKSAKKLSDLIFFIPKEYVEEVGKTSDTIDFNF